MIKLLRNTMSAGSLPLSSSQKLKHYVLIGGTGRSGLVDNLPTCGMAQKLLLLLGQFVCHEKKLRKSKKFESTVFKQQQFWDGDENWTSWEILEKRKKTGKTDERKNLNLCFKTRLLLFSFFFFSSSNTRCVSALMYFKDKSKSAKISCC